MKDMEARAVIKLLNKRINQLEYEIRRMKEPHVKGCKCRVCTGFSPDYFAMEYRGISWYKDEL